VGTVAPDTGAILVDVAELELALINVALNARDAMDGGGRIEVAARNALPGELDVLGRYVVIEVNDTGRGIDPAVLDRVLEPFFTTKPVGKGSGLGLSQVQALCQSAGGTVRIGSRPGGGTCVQLFFARYLEEAAPATDEAVPSALGRLVCRLLLVEDNADLAGSTAALLASLGCTVKHVEGARAALREVKRSTFDVVLSDIEMPGDMDGIELATILERSEPPLPAVLITGYAARLDEAKALGFEVLPKPCPLTMLTAAIAKALSRRRVAGKRSA
jgi:CheY-like chemotaxis protein